MVTRYEPLETSMLGALVPVPREKIGRRSIPTQLGIAARLRDVPPEIYRPHQRRPAALESCEAVRAVAPGAGSGTETQPADPAAQPFGRRPEQGIRRVLGVAARRIRREVIVAHFPLAIPENHADYFSRVGYGAECRQARRGQLPLERLSREPTDAGDLVPTDQLGVEATPCVQACQRFVDLLNPVSCQGLAGVASMMRAGRAIQRHIEGEDL